MATTEVMTRPSRSVWSSAGAGYGVPSNLAGRGRLELKAKAFVAGPGRTQPRVAPGRILQIAPDRMLRLGLATLFFINALIAVVRPAEFVSLIDKSTFGLLSADVLRLAPLFIAVNDGMLAVLLFLDRWARIAWLWTGVYLGMVTLTKVLALAGPAIQ